jgi:hypothetical protein
MTVVGPKSTGKKKRASKRSPSTKKYDATKPRIQPPNKRTGEDYQDYQKKKQAEAHKRQVEKHNKAMQEEYMRNIPKMAPKPKAKSPAKPKASAGKKPAAKPTPKPKVKAPAKPKASAPAKPKVKPTPKPKVKAPAKPKAKSKSPKMGSAEGWADLRSRIKKAKEKEKKSRKTLPYTI